MNPNNGAPASLANDADLIAARRSISAPNGNVSVRNQTRGTLLADDVVVANSYWPRLVGLLGKGPSWAQTSRALWIIPCHGVHTLGMRFAIDVVFLDRGRTVVYVCENLHPWRISRVITGSRSVLELPTGTIARSQTKIGDQLEVVGF